MASMKGSAFVAIGLVCILVLVAIGNAAAAETIHIGEGGHYASGPYESWGSMAIWVNMTVLEGGSVDLYIMTDAQYWNAYHLDVPAVSFKNVSMENVTSASIHYFTENTDGYYFGETIFVVVDNRECNQTSGDATPAGLVRVSLEVTCVYLDGYGYDEGFPDQLCSILPMILLPVVAIIIVLAVKQKERQNLQPAMPPMYPYSMPPPVPPEAPPGAAPPMPPPPAPPSP